MYVWHVTSMTTFCSLKLSDVLKRSYVAGSLEKAFSISPSYLYTKDLVRKGKILTQKHSLVLGPFWCTKNAFLMRVRFVLWDEIQFKTSLQVETAFYKLLTDRLLNYQLLFHTLLNHCIVKSDVTSLSSKDKHFCTSNRPSTIRIAASKSVGYLHWPDL